MARKPVDIKRVKTILLFVLVVIMMTWFVMTVWDDLFHKDGDTIRQEHERVERRLQRLEMIKDLK